MSKQKPSQKEVMLDFLGLPKDANDEIIRPILAQKIQSAEFLTWSNQIIMILKSKFNLIQIRDAYHHKTGVTPVFVNDWPVVWAGQGSIKQIIDFLNVAFYKWSNKKDVVIDNMTVRQVESLYQALCEYGFRLGVFYAK